MDERVHPFDALKKQGRGYYSPAFICTLRIIDGSLGLINLLLVHCFTYSITRSKDLSTTARVFDKGVWAKIRAHHFLLHMPIPFWLGLDSGGGRRQLVPLYAEGGKREASDAQRRVFTTLARRQAPNNYRL